MIVSIARRQYVVLSAAGRPAGILLLDSQRNTLEVRLRENWDEFARETGLDSDQIEYLAALPEDFEHRVAEMGAANFLESLESSLSHFLTLSEREATGKSAARLFEELIVPRGDAEPVRPFVTHLPVYSLRAAATRFGEDLETSGEPVRWERAPENMRLGSNMFIAQVVGRSMEPRIPDGSFCVFRFLSAGSRQGRLLLIQQLGASGSSAEFTVKRYTSRKRQTPAAEGADGEWSHEQIRLEPLNPEFEAFDLTPDEFNARYRAIAEFVDLL